MSHLHLFCLTLVFATFSGCAFFAQPPPGWSREIPFTARAVLDEAIEKHGAGKAAREANDLIASIAVTRHDGGAPVDLSHILLWRRPNTWSVETRQPGQEPVKVIGTGSSGTEIRAGAVTRRDVPVTEVPVDRFLRHIFLLKFFREGAGEAAEIEGTVAREDGGHTLNIRKFDAMGRKWLLSLDAETFEPGSVREWIETAEGGFVALDTIVDGWMPDRFGHLVPRSMRSFAEGELVQEIEVRDLSWNRGLRDVDFAVPSR